MKKINFKIQDMGCQNCAAAIRSELEKLPGEEHDHVGVGLA